MQAYVVLVARQRLAEAVQSHAPRTRLTQGLLELGTKPREIDSTAPVRSPAAPLQPITPQEVGAPRLGRDVAVAGHIEADGPMTVVVVLLEAGHLCLGP